MIISGYMKRKKILKALVLFFAVGIISAALVYRFVINKPHTDYEKAKPAYIVSASDLFQNFRVSREEAEKKYNGQVVMLTGKIDKIEEADNKVTGVFVFEQGMFGDEGIRCTMLPGYSSSLKSIPEGTDIKLKGYLTGYNETDVILEQCSVIR
jgi:hypothetical protein